MQKVYFHNLKTVNDENDYKKYTKPIKVYEKQVVDINILLNRLKIQKKIETKKKIIFFSLFSVFIFSFLILLISVK